MYIKCIYTLYVKNMLAREKCRCNKQSSINRTHKTPNKSSVVS